MKLNKAVTHRKESKNSKRFYTPLDMAIIKHDEAELNSRVKRGELVRHNNRYVAVCGCGCEGCFIHGSFPSKKVGSLE